MKRSALVVFLLPILAAGARQATAQTSVSADGVIESTSGGFKFPDASVQTTAMPSDLESRVASLEAALQDAVILTDQSRTISIPGDYAGLGEAFAALQREHLAPGVTITLQLADGTYSYAEPLLLQHPDGRSIEILGNVTTPANVVLSFDGSGGLDFGGSSLALLDGVTVQGNQTGEPFDKIGIAAGTGSAVTLGNHVVVDGFDIGIQASSGGVVTADMATASDNALHGFAAVTGGLIRANMSSATGNGGNGFDASIDATIVADGATAYGNTGDGFAASFSSRIHADGATAEENGGSGFTATFGSYISNENGNAVNNGPFGYYVEVLSAIDVHLTTVSGNDLDYAITCNTLDSYGDLLIDPDCP